MTTATSSPVVFDQVEVAGQRGDQDRGYRGAPVEGGVHGEPVDQGVEASGLEVDVGRSQRLDGAGASAAQRTVDVGPQFA